MSQPFSEGDPSDRNADIRSKVAELEQAIGEHGHYPLPNDATILDRLRRLEEKLGKPEKECVLKTDEIEIVTGTANPQLARDIGTYLGKHPDDQAVTVFADGEPNVKISKNLRNKHVFIIQPTSPPGVSQHLMELLLLADSAKRASADEITAVIPYYGFSRSDRKDQPRVPISAALVANLLQVAGVDRIVTMDLHAPQTQGAFNGPWDNLYGSSVLLPVIEQQLPPGLVIVGPDTGAAKHAEKLARLSPHAIDAASVYKRRPKANHAEVSGVMGNVRGRRVLLADDMIDTFRSLDKAARKLIEEGAIETYAMATHGLWSEIDSPDPEKSVYPLELLTDSPIKRVWITDTVNHRPPVRNHPKISIVSSASLLGEAIKRIHTGGSLSELIL